MAEIVYSYIPVKKETKERLDKIATKNRTYDQFLTDLLDAYEKKGK